MDFDYEKLYSRLRSCEITSLDPCFHSVKGSKRTEILMAMARMLEADNECRKKCGQGKSGWTIPRSTRDNLSILNGVFRSEKSYLKGRANYSRYIGDMKDQGMIHCFGGRDIGCFYIERCIFLWKCYNPSNTLLLPGPIVDFIDSGEFLVASMLTDGIERGRSVNRKELEKAFAERVYGMTRKLPIDFRKDLPEPMKGMALEYVRCVRDELAKVSSLKGVNRMKLLVEKIPRAIWRLGFDSGSNLVEVVPRNSNIVRGSVRKSFTREDVIFKRAGSPGVLLDSELDICNDTVHLIEYLVRIVKRSTGTKFDTCIAADGVTELASAQHIMEMLVRDNMMTPQAVASWVEWFSHREDAIVPNKPLMKRFKSTWSEFKKLKHMPLPDNSFMNSQSYILDHIERLMDIEGLVRGSTFSMMIYGPMITHAYVLIELGKKDASEMIRAVIGSYDSLPADRKETRSRGIAKAMAEYGTYAGSMADASVVAMVNSLLNSVGADIGIVERGISPKAPVGVCEFWNIMESRA
jgi:hypothetical protein